MRILAFFFFVGAGSTVLYPSVIEDLLHKTQHSLEQREYVKAFHMLNEAHDLSPPQSPQRIEVLVALGHFYFQVGSLGDSEGCYRKALQIDPYELSALMGLGDVSFRRGEYLNARHAYERAKKYHPDQSQVYSAIAATF